jgi:tripartite-type tricarboxylate transporter receptor subunit TctC
MAQDWPSRPITLMVAGGGGSVADILARTIGERLSKDLGVNILVDPRPQAGGIIAMDVVAKAKPDGYTLGLITQGTHAVNPGLFATMPYDSLTDFTPITQLTSVVNILTVHPSNPAKNVADIIAQAKAKPGEVTYASGANGTSQHLAGVLLAQMAGVEMTHVPYRGTPAAQTAVLANEVTMGLFNAPPVIPLIKDGKLKALAVTSPKRSAILPDLPTIDEAGVKGYDVVGWWGFAGPAGLPTEIRDRLYNGIKKIMADPELRARLQQTGYDLLEQIPPDQFGKFIEAERAKWVPIVKASGAKAN